MVPATGASSKDSLVDISITWDGPALRGDWTIGNGGFVVDAGLHSAVLLSYFTNRRAPADWTPPAGNPPDRGGYFGDIYTRRPLGSWLWTLYRSKIGDQGAVLAQVQNYCQLALAWMIDDGIVASVTVTTGIVAPGVVGIETELTMPDGLKMPFNFSWLWYKA